MAKEFLEEKSIGYLLKAVGHLVKLPQTRMWLDYDSEADVLYLHFEEKPSSTHSEMRDDGIIFDYRKPKASVSKANRDNHLVGLTILEASHR